MKAEREQFTTGNVRDAPGEGEQAALLTHVANYNKGFAARKLILGNSETVRCEIPLNRCSFFEALEDKLLPNTKIELNSEIEKDNNLVWQAGGADCRVIITRLQIFVPKII